MNIVLFSSCRSYRHPLSFHEMSGKGCLKKRAAVPKGTIRRPFEGRGVPVISDSKKASSVCYSQNR